LRFLKENDCQEKKMKMNIVITDGFPLSANDISWDGLNKWGHITVYDHTPEEQLLTRAQDADVLIVNKTRVSAATIAALPRLKYIGVTATGYNNIDTQAAKERHIPVCNAVAYGSQTVAQHVFALILALVNKVAEHNAQVQAGAWGQQPHFCITLSPIMELSGKTLGLYGYGNIAQAVAKIGRGFGMKIIAHRRNTEGVSSKGVTYVSQEDLFKKSDIISLNASMNTDNQGLINTHNLSLMKPSALLINTARGGFIVEKDLKNALENGIIAGAGIDVLAVEPPTEGSILYGVKNCIITPHNAWASVEARQRLMQITVDNVRAFLKGKPRNIVNF
jgi:glycerate dehydrogenase